MNMDSDEILVPLMILALISVKLLIVCVVLLALAIPVAIVLAFASGDPVAITIAFLASVGLLGAGPAIKRWERREKRKKDLN